MSSEDLVVKSSEAGRYFYYELKQLSLMSVEECTEDEIFYDARVMLEAINELYEQRPLLTYRRLT